MKQYLTAALLDCYDWIAYGNNGLKMYLYKGELELCMIL